MDRSERLALSARDRQLERPAPAHSALGYLSPNRFEEMQSCKPVKSAA